jgi:hypothetical protein
MPAFLFMRGRRKFAASQPESPLGSAEHPLHAMALRARNSSLRSRVLCVSGHEDARVFRKQNAHDSCAPAANAAEIVPPASIPTNPYTEGQRPTVVMPWKLT